MICEECKEPIHEEYSIKYNEQRFCSAVCLEEWYDRTKRQHARG